MQYAVLVQEQICNVHVLYSKFLQDHKYICIMTGGFLDKSMSNILKFYIKQVGCVWLVIRETLNAETWRKTVSYPLLCGQDFTQYKAEIMW